MGFRFYKRVHFPGGSVNLSKNGASLSLGCRGAHVTLGNGSVRTTVGIPGTGIFWTDQTGGHTGIHSGPPMTFGKAISYIANADPATIEAYVKQRRAERAAKWANTPLAAKVIAVMIGVVFVIAFIYASITSPGH
jgi:hypothetical protein